MVLWPTHFICCSRRCRLTAIHWMCQQRPVIIPYISWTCFMENSRNYSVRKFFSIFLLISHAAGEQQNWFCFKTTSRFKKKGAYSWRCIKSRNSEFCTNVWSPSMHVCVCFALNSVECMWPILLHSARIRRSKSWSMNSFHLSSITENAISYNWSAPWSSRVLPLFKDLTWMERPML